MICCMKSKRTSYQVIGSCGHNLKGSSSPWGGFGWYRLPGDSAWKLGAWEGHQKQMFGGERAGELGLAPTPCPHTRASSPRQAMGRSIGCWLRQVWPHRLRFVAWLHRLRKPLPSLCLGFLSTSQGCGGLNELLETKLCTGLVVSEN